MIKKVIFNENLLFITHMTICGYGIMVEHQPSKLRMRVRFPLPAGLNLLLGSYSSVGRALPW